MNEHINAVFHYVIIVIDKMHEFSVIIKRSEVAISFGGEFSKVLLIKVLTLLQNFVAIDLLVILDIRYTDSLSSYHSDLALFIPQDG